MLHAEFLGRVAYAGLYPQLHPLDLVYASSTKKLKIVLFFFLFHLNAYSSFYLVYFSHV